MSLVEVNRKKKLKLTDKEKVEIRKAILFYSAFRNKGNGHAPEALESSYAKLDGLYYEAKENTMKRLSIIADSFDLEPADIRDIDRIEEGNF